MPEVWIIHQYATSPDLPGGSRHYDFGVEMVKAGYTIKLFLSNVNLASRMHVRDLGGSVWKEDVINGVNFQWINTMRYQKNDWRRGLNMLHFSLNLFRTGMQQKSCPDTVIGSSPNLCTAFTAYLLAKKIGAKFIFEVRDLWPQALIDMGYSKFNPMIVMFKWMERFLYRHADKIIVLAEGSIDYLVKCGVPQNKIVFIPNGVHFEHFTRTRSREEVRQHYGFDKFICIYTGAHGEANSLHTIIDAAEQLKNRDDIEFVLVGDGPTKIALMRKKEELGLTNVRFIDSVSKKEVPDLLLAADVAIITLKDVKVFNYAISPNKLFDYMAAAKPIICAVSGHIAQLVKATECGMTVLPGNATQLAQSVEKIASMPAEQRRTMGINGANMVKKRFSRTKIVKKLLCVLVDKC